MTTEDDEAVYCTTSRTFLGSSRRENSWDLTQEMVISSVLGRSFFDLRSARAMSRDDTEIAIFCWLGTVELLVPVGTRVSLEGTTFLGGASSDVTSSIGGIEGVEHALGGLPRLDIRATSIFGRVRVRTPDRPGRPRRRLLRRARPETSTHTPGRIGPLVADGSRGPSVVGGHRSSSVGTGPLPPATGASGPSASGAAAGGSAVGASGAGAGAPATKAASGPASARTGGAATPDVRAAARAAVRAQRRRRSDAEVDDAEGGNPDALDPEAFDTGTLDTYTFDTDAFDADTFELSGGDDDLADRAAGVEGV